MVDGAKEPFITQFWMNHNRSLSQLDNPVLQNPLHTTLNFLAKTNL
jgi:hypothetical protein